MTEIWYMAYLCNEDFGMLVDGVMAESLHLDASNLVILVS